MKIKFFTFFLLLHLSVFGQIPSNVKYTGLKYSDDSASVIITHKSKNALFDLRSNEFVIDFTSDKILQFPGSNNYWRLTSKSKELLIYAIDWSGKYSQVKGSVDEVYVKHSHPDTYPQFSSYNGDIRNAENASADVSEQMLDWAEFRVTKISEGIYLINSFQKPRTIGYDSMDNLIMDLGVANSGVYDVNTKSWLIDSKYSSCKVINDFVFCLNQTNKPSPQNADILAEAEYTWDVFQLTNGRYEMVLGDTYQLELDLLENILEVDSLATLNEEYGLYLLEENGEQGVLVFTLFSGYGYTQPHLHYEKLVESSFDLIVYSELLNKLLLAKFGQEPLFMLCEFNTIGENIGISTMAKLHDDFGYLAPEAPAYTWDEYITLKPETERAEEYKLLSNEETNEVILDPQYEAGFKPQHYNLGIRVLTDSLAVITHYVVDNVIVPYKSILYAGEDSISNEGSIVYVPPRPTENGSGVFNYKTGEWLISPGHSKLSKTGTAWLGVSAENDRVTYTLFDHQGQIFRHFADAREMHNPHYLKLVIPFADVDSVFPAPSGFTSHHKVLKMDPVSYVINGYEIYEPGEYNIEPIYYVKTRQGLGIYRAGSFFENQYNFGFADFIHYHPELEVKITLEGDSLYFYSQFVSTKLSAQNAQLDFVQYSEGNDAYESWVLTTIASGDTIVQQSAEIFGSDQTRVSISIDENEIIVNESTQNSIVRGVVEGYDEFSELYSSMLKVDTENSSIWRKTGTNWMQASPYYAEIRLLPHHYYIARTGSYYFYESSPSKGTKETYFGPSYFILDSTMQAIPYMDYFDFAEIVDLGFGLKVKFNEGDKYFFMTYEMKAITNSEWDDFVIENGQLKAILRQTFKLDSNGEIIFDEDGNPVVENPEKTQLFSLN